MPTNTPVPAASPTATPTPVPLISWGRILTNWLANLSGLDLVSDGKVNSLDWVKRVSLIPNYALSLDGVDDYVEVGDSSSLRIRGDLTIELWMKQNSNSNGYEYLVEKGLNDNDNYGVYVTGNRQVKWEFTDTAGVRREYTSGSQYMRGQWEHVAMVYDEINNQVRFYLNGQAAGTTSSDFTIRGDQTASLWMGKQHGGSTLEFHGQMDEVRVWKAARSQSQIQADMNREIDPNTSNLAGYWRMNEGQGVTVDDSTVNRNQGSLINGVGWVIR